eukprot:g15365.t1
MNFELMGRGWCRNNELPLERMMRTVASEAACASLCISEERCSGFGLQFTVKSDCEIYGPKLEESLLLPVPPWTYYNDLASRPELGDGTLSTECYRKLNVKHCQPSNPDDKKYYYLQPCQEGITIAEGGSCTLMCNTQAGYVPFPAPPKKAVCLDGQLVDGASKQPAGCVTAAQQVNLQLLAQTTDLSWPTKRLSAPLRSWWFDRVDLDLLYGPQRREVQRFFTIARAEFETFPICNGYAHYPQMAGSDSLVLPMNVDLVTEMRHSLQHALQLPNQTFALEIS